MRLLLVLTLFWQALFALEDYWTFEEEFSLKKDEFILYRVKEKDLFFRWTLFHNNGLVYLAKYDLFPYQGILYDRYRQNSFKMTIGKATLANREDPYCMIVFEQFNVENMTSDFKIYCKDDLENAPITRITGQ